MRFTAIRVAVIFGCAAIFFGALEVSLPLKGIQLNPMLGNAFLALALLSFVVTLAAIFWPWIEPRFPRLAAWIKGLRRYVWLVGGPVVFGALLGGMEWLISNSLRNALWIGLPAFALAQIGFAVWMPKLAAGRKQVQELAAEMVRITDQNCQLRETNEDYEKRSRKREEAHQNRIRLIHELRQLWEEGERLTRYDHTHYDFEDWKERVGKLIEMARGATERRALFRVPPDFAKYSRDVEESDPPERIETQYILDKIRDFIWQMNTYHPRYDLPSDFKIRDYWKWKETR